MTTINATDALREAMLDSYRLHALAFARAKRRLPANEEEFIEWLIEFDALMGEALRMALTAYREHMDVCVRPALIDPKGKPV